MNTTTEFSSPILWTANGCENITYVLLCAVGGVLLGTGLGAVSNQVLKRTSLV